MHCKNTACLIATETPIGIITVKIATQIFDAETVTYICTTEISNCIIATETVMCIIVTERSINISVTYTVQKVPPQNLYKGNRRRFHQHNCHRKCQFNSSNRNCHLCRIDYRNFHLQKWRQSEIVFSARQYGGRLWVRIIIKLEM